MPVRLLHATASQPGAIAILQLHGDDGLGILRAATGVRDWPLHRIRLVDLAGIDEGLAVRLTDDVTQLMPHGGPRVVQRLTARLIELGVQVAGDPDDESVDPRLIYPEAADRFEALMLAALARAQSRLAIDLLLDQPRRWRLLRGSGDELTAHDLDRSKRLNRLIDPPLVVLAGRPNVGKSTLSNALLGRSMSIALDMPGTTRDYTAGRIDLAGLVVDWHDTPGMRQTADPIERKALELAHRLLERADLLIAMADPEQGWPPPPPMHAAMRPPDLRVMNKIDLGTQARRAMNDSRVIGISAQTGEGLPELVRAVRDLLVPPADLRDPGAWLFDRRLRP